LCAKNANEIAYFSKNPCTFGEEFMYRHTEKQREFVEFNLPFGGKLLASNRWIKLSQVIPWHQFEDEYCAKLSNSGQGPPAFSVRMALAALIIKRASGSFG
jgi:hypothetical protein